MERRLAAIVCADVAGYSRMMGADEAGTHAAFKAHRGAVHPIILNHGGRIVKKTGDGFLVEFPSIVGAIEAAVAMQMLMAERNAHLPADRMMQFRLGVHMGDVIADEDELFGDGVNLAVRLEAAATPGGVAVSSKAHQEASKHLSVVFADAGSFRFKNIEDTVNVWAWKPGGADKDRESRLTSSLAAQYRTAIVGVLPFANLSDSSDEYFSDGLAEDLIHALSLQSFFRVLSRNSTFAFKDKGLNARLIAREIDATYLIQGSVRRAGSKIRVTAELIVPENGEQLWAGRYDRDIGDLFAVQDDITANLCTALVPEIYRAEFLDPGPLADNRSDRLGSLPEGTVPLLSTVQGGLRKIDRAVQGGDCARSDAGHCACLSRHHPDAGHPVRLDSQHARAMGRGDQPRRGERTARSPLLLRLLGPVIRPRDGGRPRSRHGGRAQGRRAEPLRHGRGRRARHLPFHDRRASARDRVAFDRCAARQQ